MMETFKEVISAILFFTLSFASLALPICSAFFVGRLLRSIKDGHKRSEELIEKRSKEIADGIGKELAKTKEENERLKKLSDRALLEIDRLEKAVKDLRADKAELKKENKKLKEQPETK